MKKRIISLFMALVMCLTMLPAPVLAAEPDSTAADSAVSGEEAVDPTGKAAAGVPETTGAAAERENNSASAQRAANGVALLNGEGDTTETAVAKVTMTARDGTSWTGEYTDLLEAFKAAKIGYFGDGSSTSAKTVEVTLLETGKTYTLEADSTNYLIRFEYDHSVIIDLSGCTLKRSVNASQRGILMVKDSANVTLKNGTLDLDDSGSSNPAQAIGMSSDGGNKQTLTLEDMTIKTAKGYAIRAEGGTLNIKSGTYSRVFVNNVHAVAKLSGGSYDSVICFETTADCAKLLETGYVFAKSSDNSYIDPSSVTGGVINDVKVIPCLHQIGYADGKCNACGLACTKHKPDGDSCSVCGQKIVASDGSNYYVSLTEAFEKVANSGTLDLLEALPSSALTYDYDNKSVTLHGLNACPLTNDSAAPALTVSTGNLTIAASLNPEFLPTIINNGGGFAVSVTGGTLAFEGKVILNGGLQVIKGGELEGGLKEGSILTAGTGNAMEGGSASSVSVRDYVNNTNYGKVLDLLAPNCAFAEYNNTTGETGDIVSGNDVALDKDVIVVAHPKHNLVEGSDGTYACACGFTCAHEQGFENGLCKICGAACPHNTVDNDTYTCAACHQTMAVKVEKDGVAAYYAKSFDTLTDTENTLQALLNDAARTPSGSTITLLTDDLQAFALVKDGKTITLDLNGKNLIEIGFGGIAVDPNSKLTVTGEGSSTPGQDQQGTPYVFNVRGGTLEFHAFLEGNFTGIRVVSGTLTSTNGLRDGIHIGTLQIGSSEAKISFKAAAFDKIEIDAVEVKLGDLLEKNCCNAFRYNTEDNKTFLPYNTKIPGGRSVENVIIVGCSHDSVTGRTCNYCGTQNLVAIAIDGGGSLRTYFVEDDTTEAEKVSHAFSGWSKDLGNGGTLKLFVDANLTTDVVLNCTKHPGSGTLLKTNRVLDLNGHKVTGNGLTANDLVTLTITASSEGKSGSMEADVTVNQGASLIVDSIAVGEIIATDKTARITLKVGSKFTGYKTPKGMALVDWIEDGDCIMKNGYPTTELDGAYTEGTGNYTVTASPATFTKENTSGTVEYGGYVSETLLPTITLSEGAKIPDHYMITWYRRTDRTDTGIKPIRSGTLRDGQFEYNASKNFSGVTAGDRLEDVFCIVKAFDKTDQALWVTALKGYTLTVTKGTAQVSAAPTANTLTYNRNDQALVTAGSTRDGTLKYSLSRDGVYSDKIPTGKDAGEYIVWYKVEGNENHKDSAPASVTVTIQRKKITDPVIVVEDPTYTGQPLTPAVTVWDGEQDKGVVVIDPSEYTVGKYQNNIDAGGSGGTVTITDKPNGNYEVNGTGYFTIQKAAAPTLQPINVTQRYNDYQSHTITLPDLTTIGMPEDAKVPAEGAFPSGSCSNVALVGSWDVALDTGAITYTLKSGETHVGQTFTYSVTVRSQNYEDATVEVQVTLTEKDTPVVTANDITVTYTGSPVDASAITGTATFNNSVVTGGTWSWKEGQALTNVTDSGLKTVVFKHKDYETVEATIRLTIQKADSKVAEVPTAKTLLYTGEAQQLLLTAGSANGGTLLYSLSRDSGYSADIPKGKDAGEYTVWYKVQGDANHKDSAPASVTVRIARPQVIIPDYTYGATVPTPILSENPGNGAVTYYYTTTETNSGGKEWKDITGTTLQAGTYYMYAVIAKTDDDPSYTTDPVAFRVTKKSDRDSMSYAAYLQRFANSNGGGTDDGKTVKSAGTGDMGIALYAVTALLSITGMAWSGKKRKD